MNRVSDGTLDAICGHAERCEARKEATTFQWIALDCRDARATIADLRAKLAASEEALRSARGEMRERCIALAETLRTELYVKPTYWDYGAQDACVSIQRHLRALPDTDTNHD